MNRRWLILLLCLFGTAALLSELLAERIRATGVAQAVAQAQEPKKNAPQVLLSETYNAVTKVHFTNVAVHKGSPEPNPVKRRFRVDLKYWLMDAKYYDKGALSIGNPELVNFVQKVGGKSLPAGEPTTLSVMAYGIGHAVLNQYPIVHKVEVRLIHFSKGLEVKDEGESNHVVRITLQR